MGPIWCRRASVVAGAAALELGLVWLGLTFGSTRKERTSSLPGDGLVPDPVVVTNHATTIAAPPSEVWPWLVQMGWGRGGWYTARWVDRLLFPANGPSADRIIPELQSLQLGDFVPDGPPATECGFVVATLEPERALVLRSTSHLPMSWRAHTRLDWTWAFVLTPVDGGRRARFQFRSRWVTSPWWLSLSSWVFLVPADFVMSRSMLRGLRRRVERRPARQPSTRARRSPPGPPS